MRVAAAVARPLQETQVRRVVDAAGELADGLGQPAGVVGHLDALDDLRLGKPLDVQHRVLALDLLPLEADPAGRYVEALAVLPGRVEQAARHLRTDVAVLDL